VVVAAETETQCQSLGQELPFTRVELSYACPSENLSGPVSFGHGHSSESCQREVPNSSIIAMGSAGAVGGHHTFIVDKLRVHARV
jgi:hypothetical protein